VWDENIFIYASSLSFHTLFSLIPTLLIFFSVFIKMPIFNQYYEKIKSFIFSILMPTNRDIIANYLDSFLQNSEKLGIISFLFIIFVSIIFFQTYEMTIQKILNTPKRGLWNSISTYWSLITLAPIGLSMSFFFSNKIETLLKLYRILPPYFSIALDYTLIWIVFLIIYSISINRKTGSFSLLFSSFSASLIWNLSKNIFIFYVTHNKTYFTIYGSFSTILFFFLWIYISWIIFLMGLKLYNLIDEKNTAKK